MKNLFKLTRLWVASLLLLFGFTTNAWGTDSHFCLGGNPINGQWSKNTTYKIGTGYGENNKYYIVVYMKNGDYFSLYQENAGDNTTKRYCPDSDVEVQPGNGGSQGSLHDNNDNCKSWKYVGETGYVKVCIDVNNKEYSPYVWVEKYQFLTDDLKDVLKGNKVQFYFGDQRGDGWRHLFTKSGHKSEDRAWFAAAVRQGSCFVNSSDWGSFRWAPASVASVNYYLSDNDSGWDGLQIGESAVAGKAYMLYGNSVGVAKGDNRSGASFNNASSTITRGTSASGLSATLSYQTSVINATNSIKYYITSDNFDNYEEFNPTNASSLDAGTYTIAAIVTDGNIYVKAATATLTVTEPTYTVTINNGDHGTVSPNGEQQVGASGMNLTVTPNDCYSHTGWNTTGGASVSDNKVTATSAGSVTALYSERFYLRGSLKNDTGNEGMPGWGNDAPFVYANSEFAVTRTLTAGKVYKFMIYDKTADKQKGCTDDTGNSVIPWNTAWTCNGDYQICFTANVNGDYKFVVTQDGDNPQITVIPPSQTIDLYKDGSLLKTIPATFGQAFDKSVLKLPDDTAKTGYSFNGFFDAASGGKGVINKSLQFTANGTYGTNSGTKNLWCYTNTTLNAHAQYSANTYKVTLIGGSEDGDKNGSATVTYNVSYSTGLKNIVEPTKKGYHVRDNAYYTDNTYTNKVANKTGSLYNGDVAGYLTGGKWTRAENTTLYTYFEPNQYTLTLDDNGGSGGSGSKNVTYDASTNLSQKVTIPTKTGQDFTGYWTNNDGTGSQLVGTDGYFLNEVSGYIKATKLWGYANNLTIYAGWANHVYSITYKDQGDKTFSGNWGEMDHPTTHTYNTATTLVAAPDKTGYTFGGWFISSDCTGQAVTELGATAYTADITLYAKWNPTTTTITIDRQDGSATKNIIATYDGSISAVTGLADADYQRTGYTFNGMRVGTDKGSAQVIIRTNDAWAFQANAGSSSTYTNGANPPVWKYTPSNLTLYTRWDANQYTITLDDNGGTGGSGSIQATYDSNTGIASGVNKPSNDPQIFAGYWTKNGTSDSDWGVQVIGNDGKFIINAGTGAYTDASGNWKYADAITLYAKWDAPAAYAVNFSTIDNASGTLTAIYKGSEPVRDVTTGDEIDAGTVITLTFAPNDGAYKFGGSAIKGWKLEGWYSDVEHTQLLKTAGNSNSYDYTVPTNESSVYAYAPKVLNTFAIAVADGQSEMGSVNINQGTAGPAQYQEITANPTTLGYHFVNWTAETIGNFAFVEGTTQTSASVKVAMKNVQNQTLIANFAETTVDIVPTVNGVGTAQGYTASASVSQIGIATTSVLTATTPLYGYKFVGWVLSENLVVKSGLLTDLAITVSTNGDGQAVSAQAVYAEDLSSNWYLAGEGVFGGWGHEEAINMTKKAGESTIDKYYAEIEITTLKDDGFKVLDHSTSKYWTAENHWVNRDYPHHDVEQKDGEGNHMIFKPDMVGTYKFMLDCTESKHRLTVTFPTTTTYNVDIYYDGVTKTTVEGGSFTKQITAQVPESMQFDHWEVEGETTHVNIDDVNSQTTTFTASGEGAIIRAKFNTNKRIYLKGGSNFSDAYINFYKSDYWNSDLGSGNTGSECVSKSNHMNKVTNTDIFWYDLNVNTSGWNNYFSFVNKGGEFNNFSMCNVVYRNDMKDALPFYVPRNSYASEHHNTSQYFNEGIWMKYNDTYSGYKLHIIETGSSENDYFFNAETPGGYEFKTKVSLNAGVTYKFKIYNENNTWYGATGQTMTATSCTNWKMHLNNEDCQITTTEAGEYTFVLNLGSGEVIISVEYPLSASDYRVVAKQGGIVKWEGDLIKHSNVAKNDTTSFFNNNYTYQLQQYAGKGSWSDVGEVVTITDDKAQKGVINLIVTQDGTGQATLAYEGVYTGNFYIRTDGVDGGWGGYETNTDNKMENYGSLIDADPTYQYDVYKAKWVPSGKNMKFRVANDYSKAISDEFTTDDIIDNKETLPEGANVRFMWNSKTNELKRAYLSGSTDDEKRYLMLINTNSKMYDKTGETQIAELKFSDKNNWVYQADIQAQPGCEVKLTAQYNGKVQYFIGSASDTRKIIDGDGTNKYSLRTVYDFKTNRLVAGWMPDGATIYNDIVLGSDMLIERTEQGDASQIVFGGENAASLSISNIQHIYGVLKLTKESMLEATATTYGKCIYWISFPFDVKVSEIFGVEKYGEVWAISNYRGDLRAQKGWFKQDTQTFWEFLSPSDIMKANVGYTLNLDPDYFNKETSEPWKSGASEVAWYFPSMQENISVVSLAQKDTTLAAQHCDIDREFNAGTDDEPRMVNHKFTDSNWRVIGVPAFQNLQAPAFNPEPADDKEFGLKGFYEWVSATNTYTARSASEYTFKATGAYMLQYEGKITWSNAAVITTNKAPWHAPEYTYADAKNYSITLEFGDDAYTDQTFVTLIEKASTDFVLNEDMMKIDNAGFPNIYSFAGAYDVAYNETTFDNQTVMLGVSAPKDGSYTFAMPKDFSGKAVLVDLESGEATDLNLSNYTVELNKGTYNNRFQLLLEVEAKAPTNMNPSKGEWSVDGKTKKLFINDNIYLINGGRIFNATGTKLR